jgi:anti-sigma regulatory factor (Ser/Thr protein kinase)
VKEVETTNNEVIEESETQFSSDTQLLSELGERLISKPHIALAELVKNCYDADATKVNIWIDNTEGERKLILKDNGNGMSKDQFLSEWMKIGTRSKMKSTDSNMYSRKITGSKGIGRFATRFLGGKLKLETVALAEHEREYRKITAEFPWVDAKEGNLSSFKIHYKIIGKQKEEDKGTALIISDLRYKWSENELKEIVKYLAEIVSPPLPKAIRKRLRGERDPGLTLLFGPPERGENVSQAMDELFERFLARMDIYVNGDRVEYTCRYKGKKELTRLSHKLHEGNMLGVVFAQIRYYPRRKDAFANMETIDGRKASKYLTEYGGVRVFDRGIRVLPYGEINDDWLGISKDKARNSRKWGSDITESFFPENSLQKAEALNPVLNTPANHQLLGAVYVESVRQNEIKENTDQEILLLPAMDREGFLDNQAFKQLVSIIRAGVDIIGKIDKEEALQEKKEKSRKETIEAVSKINEAIDFVSSRGDIKEETKDKIINSYEQIKEATKTAIKTQKEIVESMEYVSLLGVLGGFMTHETYNVRKSLDEAIIALERIPKQNLGFDFSKTISEITKAKGQIENQIEYITLFLHSARDKRVEPFNVKAQTERTIEVLKEYMDDRRIEVDVQIPNDLKSPAVSVVVFTGVLMNLLTNSIKALLPSNLENKKVRIGAVNDEKYLKLLVMDNGIGIPPSAIDFIFEPFFTTTSELEGPFGVGMGLGLYIVKRALESSKGKIRVTKADPGFNTCFEVLYEK